MPDEVNTIVGDSVPIDPKPAGAAISPTRRGYPREVVAATARITRKLGTPNERLAILASELGNCQTAGLKIRWGKSQTNPPRILIAIYQSTICQKCNGFLAIHPDGMVNCQNPTCELFDVTYLPDELPDKESEANQ